MNETEQMTVIVKSIMISSFNVEHLKKQSIWYDDNKRETC